jgi:hypothetical protein
MYSVVVTLCRLLSKEGGLDAKSQTRCFCSNDKGDCCAAMKLFCYYYIPAAAATTAVLLLLILLAAIKNLLIPNTVQPAPSFQY